MTAVERAIIASSLMNTMFMYYDHTELNSTAQKVRRKVSQYMRNRKKSNPQEFLRIIELCDKTWRNTVDHFAEQNLKIEAKFTIASVYNNMQDVCISKIGIKENLFERFMVGATEDAEAEHNSDIIIEYFLNEIGIGVKKKSFALPLNAKK